MSRFGDFQFYHCREGGGHKERGEPGWCGQCAAEWHDRDVATAEADAKTEAAYVNQLGDAIDPLLAGECFERVVIEATFQVRELPTRSEKVQKRLKWVETREPK